MKIAQEAAGCARIGKWYQITISGWAIEFERLLKPFKVDVSGDHGGKFSRFTGGIENG